MAIALDDRRSAPPRRWDHVAGAFPGNMLLAGVAIGACWSAWITMGGQWFEPGFNPSGILTMASALAVGAWRCRATRAEAARVSSPALAITVLLLLAYAVAYGITPRLVTSALAVLTAASILLAVLPRRERDVLWGLLPWLLASLPLGIAVNLYFGYPLRVAVGWLSSALLLGQVTPLGTGLSDGVHTVFVDAPCSGIQMLRVAVLLSGILAVVYRLRSGSTALLCATAVFLAFLGNALRVYVLFLLTRRGEVSDWMHTWSGVGIFAGCAVALVALSSVLAHRLPTPAIPAAIPHRLRSGGIAGVTTGVFFAAAIFAFLAPLRTAESGHAGGANLPWPEFLDGEVLEVGPPDLALAAYRSEFLGSMMQGRLLPSGRLVLLRQCSEPTLTLHTSENCYAVAGFRCAALPAERDAQGHLWSRFSAVHEDGRAYIVRQCFFDIEGDSTNASNRLVDWTDGRRSWPDSSSWYWAVARPGSGVSHTLAVTIAERVESSEGGRGVDVRWRVGFECPGRDIPPRLGGIAVGRRGGIGRAVDGVVDGVVRRYVP